MVYVVVGVAIALVALAATLVIGRKSTTSPAPGPIAQRLAEPDPAGADQLDQTEGR